MVRSKVAGLLAALLMALGFVGASTSVAHADPTPGQPATVDFPAREARQVALYVTRIYFKQMLAGPKRKQTVDKCHDGPKLWKCPAVVSNSETKCKMVVWIWQDAKNYYFEWHQLRCRPR